MCVYLYLFSWNLMLSIYIMAIFKSHQILHVEKKKTIEYKLLFRRSNGKHHFFYNFLINACIHKLQKILTRKFKFWYGYLHFLTLILLYLIRTIITNQNTVLLINLHELVYQKNSPSKQSFQRLFLDYIICDTSKIDNHVIDTLFSWQQ